MTTWIGNKTKFREIGPFSKEGSYNLMEKIENLIKENNWSKNDKIYVWAGIRYYMNENNEFISTCGMKLEWE